MAQPLLKDHSLFRSSDLDEARERVAAIFCPHRLETVGRGARLVARVREAIAPLPVRVHFHNTRNTGLANVWAAVEAGASAVDAALGGIGGCPFAPGASGNLVTEDLVLMLNAMGCKTGIDLDKLLTVRSIVEEALPGEPLYGFTPDAGPMLDYRQRIAA